MSVLFADNRAVVVDKPAGLPVHAGPGGRPCVEDHFPQLSRRRAGPWLAHRLDADTAGCLAIALRRAALIQMQAAFAAGQARKIYWAIVHGAPATVIGRVEAGLLKQTGLTGWRMRVSAMGEPARTDWRVLGRHDDLTWIEAMPRTGRTHQIRAHLAHLGCPIVGDPVYGGTTNRAGPMLHLLARSLHLPLIPPIAATAPPPAHMRAALRACGWNT